MCNRAGKKQCFDCNTCWVAGGQKMVRPMKLICDPSWLAWVTISPHMLSNYENVLYYDVISNLGDQKCWRQHILYLGTIQKVRSSGGRERGGGGGGTTKSERSILKLKFSIKKTNRGGQKLTYLRERTFWMVPKASLKNEGSPSGDLFFKS